MGIDWKFLKRIARHVNEDDWPRHFFHFQAMVELGD